jgi:hypothetical protein
MDWLKPDLLKHVAETIGYAQTIFLGVVAILGAVGAILKWGFAPFRWIAAKIGSHKKKQPIERPIRFVLEERQSFWGPAKSGHEDGTQVHGHWHVTNMTDRNVVLLRARLEGHEAKNSHVLALTGTNRRQFDSRKPIPAQTISEVMADFMFFPAICGGSEPVVCDVIFTDNYEDEHRIRSVRFRYIRA